METRTDWTPVILAWGNAREWKPLTERRCLRRLRDFAAERGTPLGRPRHAAEGIAQCAALQSAYAALATASDERRKGITCWPEVKALISETRAARAAALAADDAAARARHEAQAESPGWRLLAGEDTELVACGTRAECLARLHEVCRCPRDGATGLGCWALLAPDGAEAARGRFDAQSAW